MILRKIQYLFLCFAISSNILSSNPLPIPQAFISELKFENDGTWVLEISFQFSAPFRKQTYDSILVASSSGTSKIKLDFIPEGTQLYVITSESLQTPIVMNKSGDCIKLYSFIDISSLSPVDSVLFGTYPGSQIVSLQPGYSICRVNFYNFCKDKSPTIGTANDTAGTIGILKGYMYDKDNKLITKGDFKMDFPIYFSENGSYSTPIFTRKNKFTFIQRFYAPFTSKFELIDSISLDLEPDSVLEKDIHFKDYVVSVKEYVQQQDFDLTVINYPNPFNSSTNFFVKIPNEFKYKTGRINIYRINGEKIYTISVSGKTTATWDGRNTNGEIVSSGVYYYQLELDNSIYKNGSMVFLK